MFFAICVQVFLRRAELELYQNSALSKKKRPGAGLFFIFFFFP
jgi:hypothetical protein